MKKLASVSLTTVLVIGLILILFGIGITNYTLDLLEGSRVYVNYNIAKINARSCFEEALFKLKEDITYAGNGNLSLNNGSCTYSVATDPSNPSLKVISIYANNDISNIYITKIADTSQRPFIISNP